VNEARDYVLMRDAQRAEVEKEVPPVELGHRRSKSDVSGVESRKKEIRSQGLASRKVAVKRRHAGETCGNRHCPSLLQKMFEI
jgi:hypothetical protein